MPEKQGKAIPRTPGDVIMCAINTGLGTAMSASDVKDAIDAANKNRERGRKSYSIQQINDWLRELINEGFVEEQIEEFYILTEAGRTKLGPLAERPLNEV